MPWMGKAGLLQYCLVDRVGDHGGGAAIARPFGGPANTLDDRWRVAWIGGAGTGCLWPFQRYHGKAIIFDADVARRVDNAECGVNVQPVGEARKAPGILDDGEPSFAGGMRLQGDFGADAGRVAGGKYDGYIHGNRHVIR